MRPHLRSARPTAQLRNGRTDWYRIENHSPTQTARVLIYDEIGYFGVTAQDFVKELDALKAKAIDLRLNSPGGDVFDGIAIYNALRNHPAKVTATVDGLAASAASFIAMAGDEVVVEPSATMMIHDAMGLCIGNAADMTEQAKLLDQMSNTIAGIYATRSGRPVDDYRSLMSAETWFTADEAVAAGLADRVAGKDESSTEGEGATPAAIAAQWDLSIFNFAGRDQAPEPVIPPAPATPVATAPLSPAPWSIDPAAFRNAIKEGVR